MSHQHPKRIVSFIWVYAHLSGHVPPWDSLNRSPMPGALTLSFANPALFFTIKFHRGANPQLLLSGRRSTPLMHRRSRTWYRTSNAVVPASNFAETTREVLARTSIYRVRRRRYRFKTHIPALFPSRYLVSGRGRADGTPGGYQASRQTRLPTSVDHIDKLVQA